MRRFGVMAIYFGITVQVLAGCSTQAWYEGMQHGARMQCNAQPPGASQDCASRVDKTPYDDYQKQRSNMTSY